MSIRKTITIFSLCLAALLPLCLSGIFIAGQIAIRSIMEEKMERQPLQTVHIPTKSIHWHKQNKELSIDGKMFDVKSIRQSGDTSILTGLYDEEDTALHEAIVGLNEQKNKGNSQSLLLFQASLGIVAEENPLLLPDFQINDSQRGKQFASYSAHILGNYRPCFSPPPEQV